MDMEFLKSIILSIVLGFLIGLERNISFKTQNEKGFAGSRTFGLISLLGYLSAFINERFQFFVYLTFFGVILLSAVAYFLKVYHYNKQGTTTNFSALIAFIIGILIYEKLYIFAIITTIVLIFLLNLKTTLKTVESKLSSKDINAAILLFAMTFLVLPYLPDKMVYYINPYKTWLMAVIISSLSFLGYLAIKFVGEKYGILLIGAAGGFASSTAVTYSLSKIYSKLKNHTIFTYAAAIAIANTIMFTRVFVEILLINQKLALFLAFPYLFTTIIGVFLSYRFYKNCKSSVQTPSIIKKNPIELNEAIKFAIILALIYSLTYYIGNKYGNVGIYIISFISGLTDVDAITLSLSSLAKKEISLINASLGIVIASLSNTIFKLSIVYFSAPKELFKKLLNFFIIILLVFIISFILNYLISIYY